MHLTDPVDDLPPLGRGAAVLGEIRLRVALATLTAVLLGRADPLALLWRLFGGAAAALGLASAVEQLKPGAVTRHLPGWNGDWFLLALAAWALAGLAFVAWYGRTPKVFEAAARSVHRAAWLKGALALGTGNPVMYRLIRALYLPEVERANTALAEAGLEQRFRFVDGGACPQARAGSGAVIAVAAEGDDFLETVIQGLDPTPAPSELNDFAEERQAYMATLHHRSGRDFESGENFVLRSIEFASSGERPRLRIRLGAATYGQIMRGCDALLHEFALCSYLTEYRPVELRWGLFPRLRPNSPLARRRSRIRLSPGGLLRTCTWRRAVHRGNRGENLFLRPRSRAAGLGVAVTTLMPDDHGNLCVWLGMRSSEVGTYPDVLHIVPAGMCATRGLADSGQGGDRLDWVLATTMQAEFLEEWLGREEFEEARHLNWRAAVAREFQAVRPAAGGELRGTGLAFDLLNLRPEVCAVLRIEPTESMLNWEYAARQGLIGKTLEQARLLDVDRMVQSGAASITLALETPQVIAAQRGVDGRPAGPAQQQGRRPGRTRRGKRRTGR